MIRIKRIYEPVADEDGKRILVDRLWPRGVSKERACLDRWAKELAPSPGLCKWFSHDPAKWPEFQRRYLAELEPLRQELGALANIARNGPVTLLFAARDEMHNEAVVLEQEIRSLL